uniref:Formamidopyrimidine-DNA glycosylase n=1 Tax=Aetherobacter rufus TaxID=888831 RepID=A0A3S7UUY3_9BACT|nr:formamidopyrimidine-DNA glycosylase [Aetherobacter rufus]
MPELPEVEHAARSLRAWLGGRTILRAGAADTRIFRGSSPRDFERLLPGRCLERVDRRGKYLLLTFDGGLGLLSHLGMTGKWVRRSPRPPAGRRTVPLHSHARLVLDDGSALHYVDPRLFGQLSLVRDGAVAELPVIRALGPDALLDGIDAARLHAVLARSARPVKVALLDQSVLAGVGNIYATEALFRAGIHPARPSRSLTLAEVSRLAEGIRVSMELALAGMGEGEIAYLSQRRGVKSRFLIYDHGGAPCPRCGASIASVVLGGRTSAFCPGCQG